MGEGVRETLCSSCSHRNVCAHKDDYLNMVKSLEEMFYKFPDNEREFMYLRDPDCKFYSEVLSTPRFLTQNMNIPENEKGKLLKAIEDGHKSCNKMITEAEAVQNFNRKTDV